MFAGLLLSTTGCGQNPERKVFEGDVTIILSSIGGSAKEEYPITGTALDILEMNHTVELSGQSIRCIDGVCASGAYYWPFFVNGQVSAVGPDRYVPKKRDVLEFRFTE